MLPLFSACSVEGSSEIDVWPEFQNLTGDAISRAAFGSSYQEGRRIFQLQEEQAEYIVEPIPANIIPGYLFVLSSPLNSRVLFYM